MGYTVTIYLTHEDWEVYYDIWKERKKLHEDYTLNKLGTELMKEKLSEIRKKESKK